MISTGKAPNTMAASICSLYFLRRFMMFHFLRRFMMFLGEECCKDLKYFFPYTLIIPHLDSFYRKLHINSRYSTYIQRMGIPRCSPFHITRASLAETRGSGPRTSDWSSRTMPVPRASPVEAYLTKSPTFISKLHVSLINDIRVQHTAYHHDPSPEKFNLLDKHANLSLVLRVAERTKFYQVTVFH